MIRLTENTGKTWRIASCLFLLAAFALPAAARAQNDQQARIDRLQNEVDTLSRAVFKGENPPPGVASQMGQGTGSADAEVRLNQIETEIRTLTGRVEQQDNQIQQLQKTIDDLQVKGGQAGAPKPVAASALDAGATDETYVPGDGFDKELYDSSSAPAADASAAAAPANLHMDNPDAAAPSNAPTAGRLGTLVQSSSGGMEAASTDPARQYENAFALLRGRKYDEAEKGFSAFLSQNPDSNLAPNAQYWLGETFYARNNFERAARVFAESYQKYPKGPKGPDSLLKLALSLAGMGKKSDACLSIAQLRREYTTGAGAVLARANQESASLGCH